MTNTENTRSGWPATYQERPDGGPPHRAAPGVAVDGQFDLDVGRALQLMTEAIELRGCDYVDRPVWINGDECLTCVYAHAGAPRCLVGEVLFRAGVRVDQLEMLGDTGILELYRASRLPISVTLGAVLVLKHAQVAQDQGDTWGDALIKVGDAVSKLIEILPLQLLEQAFRDCA